MFRNKEFIRLTVISFLFLLVQFFCTFDIFNLNEKAGRLSLCFSILIVIYYITSTIIRYQNIDRLASYLRKIQDTASNHSGKIFELKNYEEGELSILHSEIYKVTKRLMWQTEMLNKDKTFLADSLADISHQLKTPLTSMMISADLLSHDNLPPQKRADFINSIQTQLLRIEWLLSTLLKMSKLDAGTLKITKKEVNLYELITNSAKHLLIHMELKNQTFTIEGDKKITANADANWMLEAISNIIKNCSEHTGENGMISVNFSDNPLYTKITISDNGEGMDKKDLLNIFRRFYKGKNASKDSVGIGLAFAKQIITLHNGVINASSTEGVGTSFEIKLYKNII